VFKLFIYRLGANLVRGSAAMFILFITVNRWNKS